MREWYGWHGVDLYIMALCAVHFMVLCGPCYDVLNLIMQFCI